MPPKKKKDNTKIKIIALAGILVAVLLVMVFFTLPSLGIELFPKTAGTTTRLATVQTTVAFPTPTFPVQKGVDPLLVQKSLFAFDKPKTSVSFGVDTLAPLVIRLDNPEEIRRLLTSRTGSVAEVPETTFMTYFEDKKGEKTAWVRIRSKANQMVELKVNGLVPGYPDMQVVDINEMGVLIYRYPDLRKRAEDQGPQLYRVLAKPYQEIAQFPVVGP